MSTNTTVANIRQQHTNGLFIQPEALVECLPVLSYQPTDDSTTENKRLFIEDVCVDEVVKKYGTPCYIYSKAALLQAYQQYVDNLQDIDHQVCYAVKTNSNLAVLDVLAKAGSGFDIVSIGELSRVLAAGGDASKVVFSGVGKTKDDIEFALSKNIGCFNVESHSEIHSINEVAAKLGKKANISLRVNPNVDAGTHPYISTGLKENKFGIAHEIAVAVYQEASKLSHLNIVGIDCHIGSQLTEIEPFTEALDKLLELIHELKEQGISIEHVDLGGGLGVQYIDEQPAKIAELVAAIKPKIKQMGLKLLLEPGRSIGANAGILVTNVDVVKPTEHKNFAIVDAAMNDLIRPALYQAEMAIIPETLTAKTQPVDSWDIVGSICETGDFLAKNRILDINLNEKLVITGAGAYGFVMSSNYNTRPRACEVMVSKNKFQVVRKRETIESLYADESLWAE